MQIMAILQTPPPMGGASFMNKYLIDILRKNRVTVYHINPSFVRSEKDRGKFNYHKIRRLLVLTLIICIKNIFIRADKVFYELSSNKSAFYKDFIIILPSLLFRKQIYYFLHMSNFKDFYLTLNNFEKYLFSQMMKTNNKFMVLSEKLKVAYSEIIPEEKLIVLENGIDFPKYYIVKKRENKNIICLHLSILMKAKGYLKILETAKLLKNNNIIFLIVGPDGPDFDEFEFGDFIKSEKLENKIRRIGKVEGKEKEEIFAEADIFLFPSQFGVEAFPLVLLEAMAYGLVIISSDVGAISEIITEGQNGFLLSSTEPKEIADKILFLMNNISELNKIKENNIRKFHSNYTIDVYEKNLLRIIHME